MNLNSTKLNYKKETTCTKFRGGKFSEGSPKIFKTSCPFHPLHFGFSGEG